MIGRNLGKRCSGFRANRVAWELTRGPLLDGQCVLHRCDERLCVNPAHLFVGDRGDNIRDASRKKRQGNAAKTHCLRGHELVAPNLMPHALKRGHRICRTCCLARSAVHKRAARARAAQARVA